MPITQPIFGFIVLISFICMLGGMFVLPLPQDTPTLQLMTTFLGILAGSFTTVVSYYFGSSKQSQTKDDAITALSTNGNAKPPVPKVGDVGTVDVAGTVKGVLTETKPGA